MAVYTIRGLLDLAGMAASKGDRATARGRRPRPPPGSRSSRPMVVRRRRELVRGLAAGPGQHKLFQRYWIGAVPMEASLPGGGSVADSGPRPAPRSPSAGTRLLHRGLRLLPHRHARLRQRRVERAVRQRDIFSARQRRDGRGRGQLRPAHPAAAGTRRPTPAASSTRRCGEMPGAMPEILPSPDFGANMEQGLPEPARACCRPGERTESSGRSSTSSSASTPTWDRGALSVVPQIPPGPDPHRRFGHRGRLGPRRRPGGLAQRGGLRQRTSAPTWDAASGSASAGILPAGGEGRPGHARRPARRAARRGSRPRRRGARARRRDRRRPARGADPVARPG